MHQVSSFMQISYQVYAPRDTHNVHGQTQTLAIDEDKSQTSST